MIAQYMAAVWYSWDLGVASAVSKEAGKSAARLRSEQILAAGAVDAAVATDDVETLSDLIFDEVNDQDRLAKIIILEAAASRLLERAVFGETAGIVGALPVALKALATTEKATVDVAGVAAAPLVKAVASIAQLLLLLLIDSCLLLGKNLPVEDAITERSDSFMDAIKKDRFTFQGALRSDDIAQLKEAQVQETRRQLTQVEQ